MKKAGLLLLAWLSGCTSQPGMVTAPGTLPICLAFCRVQGTMVEETIGDLPKLERLTLGDKRSDDATSIDYRKR